MIDPYNYHFVYTLERVKELEKQVSKHELKNEYFLEIHLKQDSQMKNVLLPFVEINHLEEDPFHQLVLKVWIDKRSRQVTKVEEHKIYNLLFLRREQTTTTVIKGLTKKITLPQGVQKAQILATYPTQR